jgi:hypothetical protein
VSEEKEGKAKGIQRKKKRWARPRARHSMNSTFSEKNASPSACLTLGKAKGEAF